MVDFIVAPPVELQNQLLAENSSETQTRLKDFATSNPWRAVRCLKRPKIDARTHLGAQGAREVQTGTHPSGNVSKIDAESVFPRHSRMTKFAMKTPFSSTTFLRLR